VKTLQLERLSVRALRNLARVDLEPAARVNVITGNNGQGKTSLLEAIYFAATSRSFRTSKLTEMVAHGEETASARARFSEQGGELAALTREQAAVITGRRSAVTVDGNRPASLAEFATRSPVVAFHPEEMVLTLGPAPVRRTLLDRLALFVSPLSADHRGRYMHALRARQQLLQGNSVSEIEAFEELCARHGAALSRARREAAEDLARELLPAFARIGAPGLTLEARFVPGGSDDEDEMRAELRQRRRADSFRRSAGYGPHRDDLMFVLDGHPARSVASQGQHRALTLALKAAETACVARARGVEPILLLDDVSSELDPDRTLALFVFLGLTRGQIFLTTTRTDLIVTPGVEPADRRDFELRAGTLA